MLDFEYKQNKGVICDILHFILVLQTAYLQHKIPKNPRYLKDRDFEEKCLKISRVRTSAESVGWSGDREEDGGDEG